MHRCTISVALLCVLAAQSPAQTTEDRRPDQAAQPALKHQPTFHAAPFRHAPRANSGDLIAEPATFRPSQNRFSQHRFRLPARQQKLQEQESDLLSDIADGRLDSQTLMDAALILGGVSNHATMRRCQGRWRAFRTLAQQYVETNGSDALKAAQLYQFMHDRILTGNYIEQCNAIDRALIDGDYNCVTASILFCCLAREYDVRVEPESLPGHVRCRVFADESVDASFHIETTDPNWSAATATDDAKHEKEARGTFDAKTGRLLTDVEVLAKLFYNRGLDYLAAGDFNAALAATELSWQLDSQHEAARDNVATVINNWALELSSKSKYEEALSLLERGQQLVPDHPILYANQTHIRAAWERHVDVQATE